MGLEPKVGSDAQAFGLATHEWAGAHYDPGHETTPAYLHNVFLASYTKYGNPDNIDEFEPNMEMGHRLIDAYLNRDYVLDDFAPVQVESQFVVPIGDTCWCCGADHGWKLGESPPDACQNCGADVFNLVGRADLIATRNNRLVVIDHKTATGVGKSTMVGWSHDFGLIGYCYGVSRSTEFNVTQFGVNIIKKLKTVGKDTKVCTACRNGKRKRLLCDECNQTGHVPMDPPKAFYREYFRVTPQDYKMLEINRIRLCTDIVYERERYIKTPETSYPMNCKSCTKYSGCPFMDICWEGNTDGKWWDIPLSQLVDFNEREPDYVDSMVKEELE
jgi:hypothetical protein